MFGTRIEKRKGTKNQKFWNQKNNEKLMFRRQNIYLDIQYHVKITITVKFNL